MEIDLQNFEVKTVCDLSDIMGKAKKYEKVFNLAKFVDKFLIINFTSGFYMFDLDKKSLYWTLPKVKGMALALTVCPDHEKMLVAYDTNKIMVFDINNRCLHPWSRRNDEMFPVNFLKRYNRMVGVTSLSSSKFLFYTNYTYCILDLNQGLPLEEVKII
jgi:hypothetical protein